MNVVEFLLDPEGHEGSGEIRVLVDGVGLDGFVRTIEEPFWEAEMREKEIEGDHASDYRGLAPYGLGAKHFMGGPGTDRACGPSDRTVLLGCECGEEVCWPLMAKVTVTDDRVAWSDFVQPHREGWEYGGLSFEFDRTQYEDAVTELAGALAGFVPNWARQRND